MSTKPIPAFYSCYLLRSIPSPSSTPYVGSTPHILRRWKQHNGLTAGGAFRTARLAGRLRPWEMACMVYGFPSQIAALQFEWAWDHASVSRHITPADRLGGAVAGEGKGVGVGVGGRRRRAKRATLASRMADLGTLVGSRSFERWPLRVRFFSKEAHKAWTTWQTKSGPSNAPNVPVELALDETNKRKKGEEEKPLQIPPVLEAVDIGYSSLAEQLEKSTTLLSSKPRHSCSVCSSTLISTNHYVVTCPHKNCNAISHLTCLAQHNTTTPTDNHIIPKNITCPGCRRVTPWINIVKEMSLRTTNPTMTQKVIKKWQKAQLGAAIVAEMEQENDDDAEASMLNDQDNSWIMQSFKDYQNESPPNDTYDTQDFQHIDDFDDSLEIIDADTLPPSAQAHMHTSLPIDDTTIIPDSDWDNVELLD